MSDPATPSNKGMPKDAVDLVSEGPDAVIQGVEQERRGGEPELEVGTGVKKVDRRTYHQGTSREAGVTIVRETETPPRTRVESHNGYRGLSGDDNNPWA